MKGIALIGMIALFACQSSPPKEETKPMVRLITLDPGHFHAALVQKSMYPDVDSTVCVYSPEGEDVAMHLSRITAFNTRKDNPTFWKEDVYSGNDFFERMINDKKGNVVVIAGNNQRKTEFISRSLGAGFHVLADKPMVIDKAGFAVLKEAFDSAKSKNLLLYDIMTERFEITTRLQKELAQMPELFGELEKGTPQNPAVTKESVHHFYKFVSGNVLKRPPWFMDVTQAGEGIVDVTTHLVDLVQWECFPEKILDYKNDVKINSARRWTTDMTLSQFKTITQKDAFPEYLLKDIVHDSVLQIYCNGEINYSLKGVHAKVSVRWNFKAPEGAGDTHYSIMRGSKANLVIRQGEEQKYLPRLYVEPATSSELNQELITKHVAQLQAQYPGIGLSKYKSGWEVTIPDSYRDGHEAHFAQVMEHYLVYLKNGKMPDWEVPNMLTKYYTTTEALELARIKPR